MCIEKLIFNNENHMTFTKPIKNKNTKWDLGPATLTTRNHKLAEIEDVIAQLVQSMTDFLTLDVILWKLIKVTNIFVNKIYSIPCNYSSLYVINEMFMRGALHNGSHIRHNVWHTSEEWFSLTKNCIVQMLCGVEVFH